MTSLGTTQLGLFAIGDPAVDESFATARRIELDATSWVEHVPGWLSGGEALLRELAAAPGWEQRDRWMIEQLVTEPRLTLQCHDLADAPAPFLRTVAHALSARYGVPYDALWMNLYRDEQDSTSWHGDSMPRGRDHAIVPVLSLGATRRFLLQPRTGGRSTVLAPTGGDLVVMGGRCQRDWRHSVPKQARPAGVRISVNFQSSSQTVAEV